MKVIETARSPMSGLKFAVAMVVACCSGFFLTLRFLDMSSDRSFAREIAYSARFDTLLDRALLGDGWLIAEGRSVVLNGARGRIELPLGGDARGDVVLSLNVTSRGMAAASSRKYQVLANGEHVGEIDLPARDAWQTSEVMIPREIYRQQYPLWIDIVAPVEGRHDEGVELRWIRVSDRERRANFRGSVDTCNRGFLQGWAVDELGPASITVAMNGSQVSGTLNRMDRTDLVEIGLPIDGGFKYVFKELLPVGSRIEVKFANGLSLSQSPCKIR